MAAVDRSRRGDLGHGAAALVPTAAPADRPEVRRGHPPGVDHGGQPVSRPDVDQFDHRAAGRRGGTAAPAASSTVVRVTMGPIRPSVR